VLFRSDEPFESTPSLDTRGCVVTTNDTIQKLSRYIQIDKTPLIIVDKLVNRPEGEIETERRSVLSMIENWRISWSEKRLDDYIHHYSSSFSSQGLTREQWKSRKEGLARINGTIRISLENISILKQKDGMIVRFIQDYAAENVANIGIKTLYLIQENNGWQIVSEHFRKTN
jgi:murein L,D-transpeptidase YafK